MPDKDCDKSPTWRYIAETLIIILITIAGYFLAEVMADVDRIKISKVDKEQYYREVQKRDDDIREIKEGVKLLIEMHLKK